MAEINELGTLLGLLQQGFTPDQARQQLDEAKAMQMAKMTGREMTRMGLIQGGQDLRRGLMAALGQEAQDPTLQMASRIRDLGNQFNTNTAEGMMQFANALAPINRQMAAQAAASARKMALDEAKLESEKALTAQRKREREAKDPRQEFIRANAGRYTTESLDAFAASGKFSDLKEVTPKEKAMPPSPAFAEAALALGFGVKSTLGEYTSEQATQVQNKIQENKKAVAKEGKTDVKVDTGLGRNLVEALKKESGAEGELAAKDFNTLGTTVAAGVSSSRNLATLDQALQRAFTGSLADVKKDFVKALDAFGVSVDPRILEAASNTELIAAMGTRYVFPLVKNFPGSLAAKELERLEKTSPNELQQPATIRRLISLVRTDLAENKYTYDKAKQYKVENKGSTIGFNAADARIEFQTKLTDLQRKVSVVKAKKSMTPQEKAEIDALKKELGVE